MATKKTAETKVDEKKAVKKTSTNVGTAATAAAKETVKRSDRENIFRTGKDRRCKESR